MHPLIDRCKKKRNDCSAFQSVKKLIFDRLTEVKEGTKTSNATPKCI